MSEKNKYEDIEKAQAKALSLVSIVLLLIVSLFLYKTYNTNFFNDPENWGVFGDYVGGTLNPILGFLSFMLLLLNLYLQRKQLDKTEEQLDLNREELKLTREELKKAADAQIDSAKVMDEQLKKQTLQQFDSLFATLLDQLNRKIEALYPEKLHLLEKELFLCKTHNLKKREQLRYDDDMASLFRFLYQILKYIDESSLEPVNNFV